MNPLLELGPVKAIQSALMCWPNLYRQVEAISISGCGTSSWVICLASTSILFTFYSTTPSTASSHFWSSSCSSTRPNSEKLAFNHYIMYSPISFSIASYNLLFSSFHSLETVVALSTLCSSYGLYPLLCLVLRVRPMDSIHYTRAQNGSPSFLA
jgi:hypothetical protein